MPSRRDFLRHAACALSVPALGGLAHAQPPRPRRQARRAVLVVLNGGLSHVDSFDPKPALARHAGKTLAEVLGADQAPAAAGAKLHPSPWAARPRGKSGVEVTELFPALGDLADRFWFFRGMTTAEHQHAPALRLLLTGHAAPGHPAIGAWLAQHLGAAGTDLPPFVALGQGRFARGDELWSAGPLPETCAGAYLDVGRPAWRTPAGRVPAADAREQERLLAALDRGLAERTGLPDVAARAERRARERRLHEVATALWDAPVRRDEFGATPVGRGCRLACDLLEKGVRVVQLFSGADPAGRTPWDCHDGEGLTRLEREARATDRALAALVRALEGRGLLDETLLVIATEFGRSPAALAGAGGGFGRDHNPQGFTVLMAGSGLPGGKTWGSTDELGLRAVDKILSPQDLLANVLVRFRLRPEEVRARHRGRVFSPIDPGSQVIRELRLG